MVSMGWECGQDLGEGAKIYHRKVWTGLPTNAQNIFCAALLDNDITVRDGWSCALVVAGIPCKVFNIRPTLTVLAHEQEEQLLPRARPGGHRMDGNFTLPATSTNLPSRLPTTFSHVCLRSKLGNGGMHTHAFLIHICIVK